MVGAQFIPYAMPRTRSGRPGTALLGAGVTLLLLGSIAVPWLAASLGGAHPATAAPVRSAPGDGAGSGSGGSGFGGGSAVQLQPAVVAPAATVALSVDGTSPSAVSLAWSSSGAVATNYFTVYVSTAGPTGPWQSVGVINSASATAFATDGLAPNTTYWWQVALTDLFGTSYSNVVNATQPTLAYLNYTLVTPTNAVFNWTNNASYGGLLQFASYVLYEAVGTAPASAVATITTVGTRSTSVAGLSAGASYSFYLNTSECFGGCGTGSPSLAVTESNAVTLGTPLPLVASVSANRPSVDVGQLDYFTCTPSGGTAPFTFAWDLGNGSFVPGDGGISGSFGSVGPVTVTCRVTDGIASQSTAATTVTVNADPNVTVSTNRSTADVGQSVGLTCDVTLGVTPYSITWTFGDTVSAVGGVATHVYGAPGAYAATCSATDATGTSAVALLSVDVSPVLLVSAAASATAAAPGTTLSFTGLAHNGSGAYSAYGWIFGDGSTSASMNATHAFGADGNYSCQFHVTDSNGATVASSTDVRVAAISVALGTVASATGTGDTVHFAVTVAGGAGGPYNVSWSFGDNGTAYGASVNHTFASAGTYRPVVTVTDRLGASSVATFSTITVTAPPPPEPWFSAGVVLGLGLLLGVIGAAIALLWQRRTGERGYPSHAGRVPATDPAKTVKGMKVCRVCGTANLSIRETCEACGAALPRSWLR